MMSRLHGKGKLSLLRELAEPLDSEHTYHGGSLAGDHNRIRAGPLTASDPSEAKIRVALLEGRHRLFKFKVFDPRVTEPFFIA